MAFFVSNQFLLKQQETIDRLNERIGELTDEILRVRMMPVKVGDTTFVAQPDVPLKKELPKPLPAEIIAFSEEFTSEEARQSIITQAYELRSLGISDPDITRFILDNLETHEVV